MSSTQQATTSVLASIVVEVDAQDAFETFTADIGSWWPPEHHLLTAPLAEMVFEPRVGGRIIDRGTDGSECAWARVLAYDPPTRLVFSWDVSTAWQLETDPAKTSEVEVRFIAESANRTRVELEHRRLDRHGDAWEGMREAVGSQGGWPTGLKRFAARVAERSAP